MPMEGNSLAHQICKAKNIYIYFGGLWRDSE
jgi:hypothetical protein